MLYPIFLTRPAFALVMLSAAAGTAQALDLAAIDTRLVASGFAAPVFATAPLADGRVFVVEKGGSIRWAQGGVVNFFLSIPVATSGEQGLLGLPFDPGYADPAAPGYRRFFVNYIDSVNRDSVVASYRANVAGTLGDAASRVEVMRWDQPDSFSNHKAGWISFKPGDSNHLFIATGDGGSGNDPLDNGQRLDTVLGKMLRIDINRDDFASATINYGVPTDNPFVSTPGARGEIFGFGLRNPWRNSFDRASGDLWIADVGQGQREEVNRVAAASTGGQNFGWRLREGDIATPGVGQPAPLPALTDPLFVYDHSQGQSITGGYVVRDATSPLDGQYVFGDFSQGRLWAIPASAGPKNFSTEAVDITDAINAGAGGGLGNIASFGEGAGGELYIVDYGGRVVQVVSEPGTTGMLIAGLLAVGWVVGRRLPR